MSFPGFNGLRGYDQAKAASNFLGQSPDGMGDARLKAHFDTANGAGALALVYATVAGFTLQEWAALAALVYSLILIGEKVWKGFKAWQAKRGP